MGREVYSKLLRTEVDIIPDGLLSILSKWEYSFLMRYVNLLGGEKWDERYKQ